MNKGKTGSLRILLLLQGFLFLKTVWPPPGERTGKLMEILHIVVFVAKDGAFLRASPNRG
jgi:hypothetical protein